MGLDSGWKAIFGILFPILLVIVILNLLLAHFWLLYLLYGIVILLLCLDIRDVKLKLADYFGALTTENTSRAQVEVEKFTQQPVDQDKSIMIRVVTGAIFVQSLTTIFSVIFWFLLLGPFGAILYYLVAAMSERATQYESGENVIYNSASLFKGILDWIPVRLVTLTYALIGHFAPVFSIWIEHLGGGVSANSSFLIDSGLTALDLPKESTALDVEENYKAAGLVTWTLWTWVIVIVLANIIGWLF